MILYYAVGGGLGHLTRARAVVHTLGWSDEVTVISASPWAREPYLPPSWRVERLAPELAQDLTLARARLQQIYEMTEPDLMVVDAFPGGILGELCDFSWPDGLERVHIARLLRWSRYARRLSGHPPTYDRTFVVEPLFAEHQAFLEASSRELKPLRLIDEETACRIPSGIENAWLVVHSEPESEILELLAYAEELRRREDPESDLWLISPSRPQTLPEGVQHFDIFPAQSLFAHARHLVSACGFNIMRQTEPFRHKHSFLPFARPLDDPFERARRQGRLDGLFQTENKRYL